MMVLSVEEQEKSFCLVLEVILSSSIGQGV